METNALGMKWIPKNIFTRNLALTITGFTSPSGSNSWAVSDNSSFCDTFVLFWVIM